MERKSLSLLLKKTLKHLKIGESLAKHTSFGVGGKATYFLKVNNIHELKRAIHFANKKNIKLKIIGNGTNVLFSDNGFNGLVVKLCGVFQNQCCCFNKISVGAGVNLYSLNIECERHSLSSLEWSYGIPGTVGGAIKMNAGAFGGQIADVIKHVKVLRNGKIIKILQKNCGFSYRSSKFLPNDIILFAKIKLKKGKQKDIAEKMKSVLALRKKNQPYNFRSAGSVFKKHDGMAVSALIDGSGLKGTRIGDAQVSKIHAGFIVNLGSATCQDILNLIFLIKNRLKEQLGVDIEEEIEIIGE